MRMRSLPSRVTSVRDRSGLATRHIYALVALCRSAEVSQLFENLLARHNRHGLMVEHLDVRIGEQWGNFVQTYSMVGLVNSAIRLSKRWDHAF